MQPLESLLSFSYSRCTATAHILWLEMMKLLCTCFPSLFPFEFLNCITILTVYTNAPPLHHTTLFYFIYFFLKFRCRINFFRISVRIRIIVRGCCCVLCVSILCVCAFVVRFSKVFFSFDWNRFIFFCSLYSFK